MIHVAQNLAERPSNRRGQRLKELSIEDGRPLITKDRSPGRAQSFEITGERLEH